MIQKKTIFAFRIVKNEKTMTKKEETQKAKEMKAFLTLTLFDGFCLSY